MTRDSRELIDFPELQDERAPASRAWLVVALVLVGGVITLALGLLCALSFEKASHLEDLSGETMVVSGTYQTLTKDLVTQDYNGVYAGVMPANDLLEGHPFDNRLRDPAPVGEGDQIIFRGTQRGAQDADFPSDVDALLAVQDGKLTVVETGEPGAWGADGVTHDSVTGQRLRAAGWGLGALVCLGLTVWGARRVHRGVRPGV